MINQDDYPANIVQASRLLAAVIVLIHYPYTIDLNKLDIHSMEFSDLEDDKEQVAITYRIHR